MKKSIVTAFIVVAFVAIAVFSAYSVFVIKDVTPTFTVTENCTDQTDMIEEKLNDYKGQNLLFLDVDQVKNQLSINPYLEIISVEKSYPNSLNVVVKERIERYVVNYEGDSYAIDGNGYVLAKNTFFTQNLPVLVVTLESKPIISKPLTVIEGEKSLFAVALTTVYNDNYTNNVNKIKIVKELEKSDLILSTSTGVTIEVWDAQVRSNEKLTLGFTTYDELLSDRDKYTHRVCVFEKADGTLTSTHTTHGN